MSRRSSSRSGGRDVRYVASSLPSLEYFLRGPGLSTPVRHAFALNDFEDRREFYPGETDLDYRPARSITGSTARLQVGQATHPLPGVQTPLLSPSIAFQSHPKVNICHRRQVRREVMHAIGRTGRGRGRQKKPRFNEYSHVGCR